MKKLQIQLLIRFFLPGLLVLLSVQTCWSASQRVALVIGNSAYKNAPLKNPANDARDMAIKLTQLGFVVDKLINADKRTMKSAIRRFGKKLQQKDTIGLFYFAGHGIQLDGSNYLLPIKVNIETEDEIEFEAINAAEILRKMERSENNLNLVILDACRNNPFARSFRSASRGLAKMEAPTGSMILYATSPGNVAADGQGNNGLFTEKLLKMMDKKGLKIEEVFKKTAIAVNQASANKQSPYIEGFILGDFYFNNSQVTIHPSASITDEADLNANNKYENRFWDSVEAEPSKEMYEAYLEKYPDGHFSSLARIKLKKLKKNSFSNVPNKTNQQISSTPNQAKHIIRDNVTGMELVKVSGGCFQMGSNYGDKNQKPMHKVCINKDYYLGKYEVTQGQWQKLMGNNPSHYQKGKNYPVENVSWDDIQSFILKLNAKTGNIYRLPTEAEWEYACRSGGKKQQYCGGNSVESLAWTKNNSASSTHPVGQKQANGFGLYDMSGNVWEWGQDYYNEKYYHKSPLNDPQGPSRGNYRSLRGGSWGDASNWLHSTVRSGYTPGLRGRSVGFRLLREL